MVHFTVKNTGTVEHNLEVELESARVEKKLFDTNLKPGEVYTRQYRGLGDGPEDFVPNNNGKDPEKVNVRYHLRGIPLLHDAIHFCDAPELLPQVRIELAALLLEEVFSRD